MLALIDTVLSNSRAGGTDKLVLVILARAANPRGYSRPPAPLIAKLCGREEQTVRDSLANLASMGEIVRVEQGGGKSKGTTWQITVKRKEKLPDLKTPGHDHAWQPPF